MMTRTFLIEDEDSMLLLGKRLAERLFKASFVALFGDLGAGKTTLVRGVASGFGIDSIASPTFNIVRSHEGRGMRLDHFDAYRLADCEELLAMGFEEYLDSDGVILMEWCEKVAEVLPEQRLEIHISGSGDETRSVVFRSFGEKYDKILTELQI